MPYHGNCCVCVLTLGLCIFGSMTTSAGVSLLMNYEVFGGNSTSPDTFPRTLPPSKWEKSVGIALSSVGLVMFLTGMIMAVLCLTVGISLNGKSGGKSKDYEVFQNEEDIAYYISEGSGLTTNSDCNSTTDKSDKKQSSDEYAYDVTFADDDIIKAFPNDDNIPSKGSEVISEQILQERKIIKSILKSLSSQEDKAINQGQADECVGEPNIAYPSVVLDDSHKVDIQPIPEVTLHSS